MGFKFEFDTFQSLFLEYFGVQLESRFTNRITLFGGKLLLKGNRSVSRHFDLISCFSLIWWSLFWRSLFCTFQVDSEEDSHLFRKEDSGGSYLLITLRLLTHSLQNSLIKSFGLFIFWTFLFYSIISSLSELQCDLMESECVIPQVSLIIYRLALLSQKMLNDSITMYRLSDLILHWNFKLAFILCRLQYNCILFTMYL